MTDDDDPPKRLTDAHGVGRAHRLYDMASEGATDERAAAAVEFADLILNDAGLREALHAAVKRDAAVHASGAALPRTLPDTDWTFSKDRRGCLRGSRRCKGVVLAVRESGTQRGTYYPVVDGHHLSAHGGSMRNMDFLNAVSAAEAHAATADVAAEEGEWR